jgi:hypothetical protein
LLTPVLAIAPLPTLILAFTVAAALVWMATIWRTVRGAETRLASASPGPMPRARWLVIGTVLVPVVAFGASLIAALSSSSLPIGWP